MGWESIEGHDAQIDLFRRAVQNGRLASTFLLVGPAGIGKRRFAIELAKSLLCETNPEEMLQACGNCPSCIQIDAGSHPDMETVSKPRDRAFIPVEVFIGDRDHRMREGLVHRMGLKPFRGGRRIAIIDDADFLRAEGANCLLKTLEEPPPRSVILLIGTSEQKQLPTIRSRCQIIRFQPLPAATVARLLLDAAVVSDPELAGQLAELSGGSLERARELADEAIGEFRQTLLAELAKPDWDSVELARSVCQVVDDAGTDAPARRERLSQLMGFAAEFYRQAMRAVSGLTTEGDPVLQGAITAVASHGKLQSQVAAACVQRCLEGQSQVRANAHPTTLVECWIDELAKICRHEATFS